MKKNGFTLVELLASLTILGILMAVTVPNVVGILTQNKEKTYNEDAKKMISTAKYKMAGNNGVVRPGNNNCILMSLGYLDNSEYENPPNGGKYLREQSFVVIKRVGKRYEYYVRLAEEMTDDDHTLFGIDVTTETALEKGVEAKELYSISNVNVELSSLDTYYIKDACGCNTVTGGYYKVERKLDFNKE